MELRDGTGHVIGLTGENYDTIPANLPEVDFETFPLAYGIDRDGTTVFNRVQMSKLAIEFERMLSDASKQRESLLLQLIEYCSKAQSVADSQLWVTGD